MAFLDRIKAMFGGGAAKEPAAHPAAVDERDQPHVAQEDSVHPGDHPVPAPQDTEPPHGDPAHDDL